MLLTNYSPAQLFQLVSYKDARWFAASYDLYSGPLFGEIKRIVSNKQVAEIILEMAFIDIFNNINDYNSEKSRLFKWMYQMMRKVIMVYTHHAQFAVSLRNYVPLTNISFLKSLLTPQAVT